MSKKIKIDKNKLLEISEEELRHFEIAQEEQKKLMEDELNIMIKQKNNSN